VAAGGWMLSGPTAVVGVVLGFVAGVPAAILAIPRRWLVASGAVSALGAVAGTAAGDSWAAVVLVLLAGLVQAPVNRVAPGALALLPVVVAIAAGPAPRDAPWHLGLWVAVGLVTIAMTAVALRLGLPPRPVPQPTARRYAVALALVGAGTLAVAHLADMPHGYWMVITAVAVLRPFPHESTRSAVDRLAGTVAGLVVAVVIAALLPTGVALLAAAGCLLLAVAWAASGDQRRSTAYAVPVVVLTASSGLGQEVTIAVERLLLTVAGIVVAVTAALVLHRDHAGTADDDRSVQESPADGS
jgi:hypothetical protein